jgi:hypothetical protein
MPAARRAFKCFSAAARVLKWKLPRPSFVLSVHGHE